MRRAFTNLSLDERRVIARMLQAKVPKTKEEHWKPEMTVELRACYIRPMSVD